MNRLSDLQNRVHAKLSTPPDTDVSIHDIFETAYPGEFMWTVREKQQRLGPLLKRINDKIAPNVIRPGEVKQTYRLDTTRG